MELNWLPAHIQSLCSAVRSRGELSVWLSNILSDTLGHINKKMTFIKTNIFLCCLVLQIGLWMFYSFVPWVSGSRFLSGLLPAVSPFLSVSPQHSHRTPSDSSLPVSCRFSPSCCPRGTSGIGKQIGMNGCMASFLDHKIVSAKQV